MLFDNASEALYAVAVPDKSAHAWVCEYVTRVIEELGYGGTRIAIKMDRAPDLQELRRHVMAKRSAPTVPLDVPVRESKANGAVENAVRRWQGQFRTIKSHLEAELKVELPREHPVLQWMSVWAAGILNRVPIRSHGRTVYEHVTGHRMKVPLAIFGESVMWRRKRHPGALNKFDSEWADGIYLGVAGLSTEAVIGTKSGIVRTNEFRLSPEGKWNSELVLSIPTSFQEYIEPGAKLPTPYIILPVPPAIGVPDVPAVDIQARRLRLQKRDFLAHGYTGGCAGCIHLQRDLPGSRNHSEACRKRIEDKIMSDEAEASRKHRADARLDDQLTRALEREEELLQAPEPAATTEGEITPKPVEHFGIDMDENCSVDTPLKTILEDIEMESPVELLSPPKSGPDVRIASPVDVEIADRQEELVAGPLVNTEVSATMMSRAPAQIRQLTPDQVAGAGISGQPIKKMKVTTPAQSAVDDRRPATPRTLEYGDVGPTRSRRPRMTCWSISRMWKSGPTAVTSKSYRASTMDSYTVKKT